jgi:hypothetical protein
MRIETLFWVSLVLCVLSFVLFALQIIVQTSRTRARRAGSAGEGLGEAEPQSFNPVRMMEEMGELSHSFAKAGPLATTAVLCILFGLIAVLSSGVIKIEP